MLLGLNQLTSIGLGIRKRPREYALAAASGAVASLGANALLIPRLGFMGAGVAYVVACAVFAAVSISLSHRHYPIDQEWMRLGRVVAAGLASYWIVEALLPGPLPPAVGILSRGALACLCYPSLLFVTGFFRRGEPRRIMELVRRATRAPLGKPPAQETRVPETEDGS